MLTCALPNGSREDNWPRYAHAVFRITSIKTRRQWLLDISGPQYGIYKNLWEWSVYQKNFSSEVIRVQSLGTHKLISKRLRNIPGNPSLVYGVVGEVAECLNAAVMEWTEGSGNSLSQMLTLEDQGFEDQKTHLLKLMDAAVAACMSTGRFAAKIRTAKAYERAHPGKSAMECFQVAQLLHNDGAIS